MTTHSFEKKLRSHFDKFRHTLSTDTGDWVVKGFIDIYRNIYTISSTKNITFPYNQYAGHFVLGVIYSRGEETVDERRIYTLDDLQDIVSVIKDFEFLLQEKWRVASDRPGSGNTKNIGSVKEIQALIEGNGSFASYGEDVFDDYWTNYLTSDMAQAIDSIVPYRNLEEYWEWRDRAPRKGNGGKGVRSP